jgi:hypothetical protein
MAAPHSSAVAAAAVALTASLLMTSAPATHVTPDPGADTTRRFSWLYLFRARPGLMDQLTD